jgi:hypothetical protein
MNVNNKYAQLALVLSLLWIAMAMPALADVKDYAFELIESEAKKSDGAEIAVRLLNKVTGKAVPDAVIFAKRIDMAPDGMATMDAPIEALPSTAAGIYRFKTNLTMAGRWRLSLAAKVQGEIGTVESKLIVKVLP